MKRVKELAMFPEMGTPLSVRIKVATDYRYLVCGNYTAFYRLESGTVLVARVLYGRRNFMKTLFGELPEGN